MELPSVESMVNNFTIHLTQDLRITSLESTVLEKGGLVKINGEGFASDDSGLTNAVCFLDKDGYPLLVPGSPMIYPDPVPGQMTYKGTAISMFQTSNFPIYYSINDSIERPYNGPFDLEETYAIKAHATVVIDGVIYRSSETTQNYITCQEGETYISYPHGAQCVVLQNQDLMPRRYCPLYSADYTDPIVTDFGLATCSYSWLTDGNDELAVETHRDSGLATAFSITQFWAEAVGRPSHVWRPTASYNFCPDGSFGTKCSE